MRAADRLAASYGRRAERYAANLDPTLLPIIDKLVSLAVPAQGERVLDLATGTGAVARGLTGVGARAVGLDISPGMVALGRQLSPPGLQLLVGNAAALPLAAGTLGLATCCLAISHMPSVPTVLAEVRRVLRAGGRLLVASWGKGGTNPALAMVQKVLQHHVTRNIHAFHGVLDEGTWADPKRGCLVLSAAGFDPVRVITERVSGSFADPRAAVDWTFSWPNYGETLDGCGASQSALILAEAESAVRAAGNLGWDYPVNYYEAAKPSMRVQHKRHRPLTRGPG